MNIFAKITSEHNVTVLQARIAELQDALVAERGRSTLWWNAMTARWREVSTLNVALRRANRRIKRQHEALKVYRDKERAIDRPNGICNDPTVPLEQW